MNVLLILAILDLLNQARLAIAQDSKPYASSDTNATQSFVVTTSANDATLFGSTDESFQKISSLFYPLFSQESTMSFEDSNVTSQYTVMAALGGTEGMVPVDITASLDVEELLGDIEAIGCQVVATYQHIVSGRCPTSALPTLGKLSTVNFVHPVLAESSGFAKRNRDATNRVLKGKVQSEGVYAMYVDLVHKMGFTGKGIKIGVLSDSYNRKGGASNDTDSGDLPNDVVVLKEYSKTTPAPTDEGRAMMQLIHDVAPHAKLYFYTANEGEADFACGIEKLAKAGCKVIVDDVIYFSEPFFQDGIITQVVDYVNGMGVAYFSAAGNYARQSWSGPFVSIQGSPFHNFNPSHPNGNSIDPRGRNYIPIRLIKSEQSKIMLQWDQPSYQVCQGKGSQSDINILIFDPEQDIDTPLKQPYVYGGTDSNIGCDAQEIMNVNVAAILNSYNSNAKSKEFWLRIEHVSGPKPDLMQIIIKNGDFSDSLKTNSGTLFGHPNAKGGAAVASAYSKATPRYTAKKNIEIESASSKGEIPILFNKSGERQKREIRNQPRFTGPDGTSNTFFGDKPINENSYHLFFGTSAAAPHVAAVAALMLEANPSLSPNMIYKILEDTAIDMNNHRYWTREGYDSSSGYGFVNASKAVEFVFNANLNVASTLFAETTMQSNESMKEAIGLRGSKQKSSNTITNATIGD